MLALSAKRLGHLVDEVRSLRYGTRRSSYGRELAVYATCRVGQFSRPLHRSNAMTLLTATR